MAIQILVALYDQMDAYLATITHMAYFSNSEAPLETDVLGIKRELFRFPVVALRTGKTITFTVVISTDDAAPTTTINGVPTATSIPLTNASSFEIGDLVRFRITGNYLNRVILNKSGSTITVDSLGLVPALGTKVDILATQRALIISGTGTSGTGTLDKIEQCGTPFFKDFGYQKTDIWNIEYKVI